MNDKMTEIDYSTLAPTKRELIDAIIHEGELRARERMIDTLESYFDLTRYSVEVEGAEENTEWDAGFQAALALIKADDHD